MALIRLLAAPIAFLLAIAGLAGCDEGTSAGPEEGVTVEGVASADGAEPFDPAPNLGQRVTVSGAVTDVVDDRAFQLGGEDEGSEPLLVIDAEGAADVGEDDEVRVTGIVRKVQEETFEEEFGFAFPEDYAPFLGDWVIAASEIEPLD